MTRSVFTILFAFLLYATVAANGTKNWPGFRGNGDSHSDAQRLPTEWNDTKNIAWNIELPGLGQSSPIVWGNRVYLTSMDGANKEKLLVYCLDLKTGRQLWLKEFANTVLPVKVNLTVSKAAPTPVVDDKGLYVFFETGDLYGFDHDGKLRWQRQLMTDYGAFKGPHGLGGSLVMNKDSLFVHVAHQGAAFLLAVNKRDGKTLWKTDRAAGKCCWTTPLVVTHQGKQQIIIQDNDAAAFDTATGKALWTFTGGFTGNAMAAPTVSDGLVLLGYDVKGKNLALKLGGTGDVTQSHVAWRAEEASLNYNSPLIHQGLVYYVNKVGVAFCLELATGKELWRQRLNAGPCWASPLAVGDRIYIFSNDGKTTVLRAGTKYEELAVNTLKDMQHVYGVAAVDGALLLRFEKRLIRLSESM